MQTKTLWPISCKHWGALLWDIDHSHKCWIVISLYFCYLDLLASHWLNVLFNFAHGSKFRKPHYISNETKEIWLPLWKSSIWAGHSMRFTKIVGLTFTLPYIQCHLLWQSNSKGRYDENVWLQSRWWQDATYDHITSWKGRLVFCLTLTLLQAASIF